MQFTTVLTFVAAALATSAAPVAPLDIYSPHITSPSSTTTWTVGQPVNVTWNTDDAPANISNRALVVLRSNPQSTLAQDFDLRAGFVTVTPPDVADGQYQIILFGDSGNVSPFFTINH